MNYKPILEGLLFVVGEEGLTISEISEILEIDIEETNKLLDELKLLYEDNSRGINLVLLGNKYKLATKKEYSEYCKKLIETTSNTLSQAALETLAVIAYNEPVTRIEIDEIRGVSSGQLVRKLVLKGLICEAGKSDLPGRPNLYKTTDKFLDYFNLSSKDELPKFDNIVSEAIESSLFETKYKEEVDEIIQ